MGLRGGIRERESGGEEKMVGLIRWPLEEFEASLSDAGARLK